MTDPQKPNIIGRELHEEKAMWKNHWCTPTQQAFVGIALKSTKSFNGPLIIDSLSKILAGSTRIFLLHQKHRLRDPAPRSCHHRT